MDGDGELAERFEAHRERLWGVAYRLLGSAASTPGRSATSPGG